MSLGQHALKMPIYLLSLCLGLGLILGTPVMILALILFSNTLRLTLVPSPGSPSFVLARQSRSCKELLYIAGNAIGLCGALSCFCLCRFDGQVSGIQQVTMYPVFHFPKKSLQTIVPWISHLVQISFYMRVPRSRKMLLWMQPSTNN